LLLFYRFNSWQNTTYGFRNIQKTKEGQVQVNIIYFSSIISYYCISYPITSNAPDQWFSTLAVKHNHLGSILRIPTLGPIHRNLASAGIGELD
jgi:hypothetical protein